MNMTVMQTPALRTAIVTIGVIAAFFALRAMAGVLTPFLLAILIAVLVESALAVLLRRGLPPWAALVVVGGTLLVLGITFALFINTSLDNLFSTLPELQQQMVLQARSVEAVLSSLGIDPAKLDALLRQAAPRSGSDIILALVGNLGSFMTTALLVLLYVIFLLVEATILPWKLKRAFGRQSKVIADLASIFSSLQSYLVVQTALSVLVGVLVTLSLWLIGVNHALTWGVLAFLLNYVPNIGPILAALPAIAMAFVQFGPSYQVLLVIGLYIVIFTVIGSFVYPRIMGSLVGLSPLVVIIAMVLWGWALGPIGLVMSVPIVTAVKIILGAYAPTRWVAILLGNAPESLPPAPVAHPVS